MSTSTLPPTPTLHRKRPLHLTIHSESQPHHRRWVRPPPRSPYPWIWSCHKCLNIYRFSAALNRCLSCSHHFCRKCISEYDYDGWDEWKAYWGKSSPATVNDGNQNSKGYWKNENDNDNDEDWDAEWLAWSPSSGSSDDENCSNDKEHYKHDAFYSEKNEEWYRRKAQEIDDAFGECKADAKVLREIERKRHSHVDFIFHHGNEDDDPVLSPDLNNTDHQIFTPISLNKRSVRPPALHLDVPPATAPGKEQISTIPPQGIMRTDLKSPEESVLSPLGYQHLIPLISEGAVGGYEPGEEMLKIVSPSVPTFGQPVIVGSHQELPTEKEDDWRMAIDEAIGGLSNEEDPEDRGIL